MTARRIDTVPCGELLFVGIFRVWFADLVRFNFGRFLFGICIRRFIVFWLLGCNLHWVQIRFGTRVRVMASVFFRVNVFLS